MAERRMFAKKIIDSDAFLDMPQSSQSLYFHLGMRADDDGFVNNPKKIMRFTGASEDDVKLLLHKRFLIAFESGVVVIKHWRIHNLIQKDRYNPTSYTEEMESLKLKENKSYTLLDGCIQDGSTMDPNCEQHGNTGKVRLVKAREVKTRQGKITKEPWRESFDFYHSWVVEETRKLIDDEAWIEELSKLYPQLNVRMTIIRACKDYWMTEDGWANKKAKRGAPDWKKTYRNAITQKFNQVDNGTHFYDGLSNYAEL